MANWVDRIDPFEGLPCVMCLDCHHEVSKKRAWCNCPRDEAKSPAAGRTPVADDGRAHPEPEKGQ